MGVAARLVVSRIHRRPRCGGRDSCGHRGSQDGPRPRRGGCVSALHAAERYVRAGFAVVPIPHRSKRPVLEGWEALRLTTDELPEHFNGRPQNVGLLLGEPSGGLVDVDLDAPEAAKIAGRFLELTLTSGRESSPHSHWWYVSPGAQTIRYKDVNHEVLVEQRSTGCQTIVAPSVHPSGERIVWHETGLEVAE